MSLYRTDLLEAPPGTQAPALDLTAENKSDVAAITAHFGAENFTLPIKKDASERAPFTEREMMFLSQETMLRFRRATHTGLQETINRLERCMVWRRTTGVDDVQAMADDCEEEANTGKNFVQGFTPTGLPIMYFFPNRNKLPVEQRRAINAVFVLERAMDLMVGGITQVMVVFNFGGKKQGPPSTIALARETLHNLSEYYPETMGRCLLQDVPWVVRVFINLMWPFVDSHTKTKVRMVPGETSVKDGDVAGDVLVKECGGSLDLPYDHEAYWSAMMKTCLERREIHHRNWLALGPPAVGREERLFKLAGLSEGAKAADTDVANGDIAVSAEAPVATA